MKRTSRPARRVHEPADPEPHVFPETPFITDRRGMIEHDLDAEPHVLPPSTRRVRRYLYPND